MKRIDIRSYHKSAGSFNNLCKLYFLVTVQVRVEIRKLLFLYNYRPVMRNGYGKL